MGDQGHAGVEYRVDQVRETIVGDRVDTGDLEKLLNERAAEGWSFKQAVPASVSGRIGPGSAEGLVLIFERPV